MASDHPESSDAAVTLADFTSSGLILPHLRGRDAAGVIQELCQALQQEGWVPDLLPFYHAALNREFLVGTDMEAGMAVPHARLPGVRKLLFAFGRSDVPLPWGNRGRHSIQLVFLLAVPATEATQHLLLISGLVRLARQPALMDQLRGAKNSLQVLQVLRQVQLRRNQDAGRALHLSSQPVPR